jgi:serine protease AprX
MEETGSRLLPPHRVRVSVRLEVPAGPDYDIQSVLGSWSRDLQVQVDEEYRPVPVEAPRAERQRLLRENLQLVVVRAWVSAEHLGLLKAQPQVNHVTRAARVEPFSLLEPGLAETAALVRADCGDAVRPSDNAEAVAEHLGVTQIWRAGYTGQGMVIGVVDGGITAHGRPTAFGGWPAIPQSPAVGAVVGGWPLDWGTIAEGWGQHGNMIAFDVQAMAPEAELWDIRIFEPGVNFEDYVQNAVEGYKHAIDHYRAHGVPQVLVNSWGVYDSARGPDYAFDPGSEIAVHVEAAIDAGILVLFAAGNCGDGCLFEAGTLCGVGDRGPGASILGPNGHPEVMTVGAATLRGAWCGYTSQGPAALPPHDPHKPDFCSISQFEGFFPNDSGLRLFDGGTSAATGVAAGVVALLRQARPDLTQEECRRLLIETARPIRTPAAQGGAGAGIIDALLAFRSL